MAHETGIDDGLARRVQAGLLSERSDQNVQTLAERLVTEIPEPGLGGRRGHQPLGCGRRGADRGHHGVGCRRGGVMAIS